MMGVSMPLLPVLNGWKFLPPQSTLSKVLAPNYPPLKTKSMRAMSRKVDFSFLDVDLKSTIPSCALSDLNPRFVDMLKMAQRMCGFAFTITSAYRSQSYERSKGRKGNSSHCKGLAVDVSARDSHTRYKVVAAALAAGITRIGIGENFVHLDVDETKAHPIIFHYYHPQNT